MDSFLIPPQFGLIGHRGLCGLAPENTLASFTAAINSGLNWIEFDIRISKDNQLVCIHDNRLERTTNESGLIRDFTSEALRQLDAGSWFDPQFANEGVPSLPDVIEQLKNTGVQLNIEIKPPIPPSLQRFDALAQALIATLKQWPQTLPLPLVSCFDWTVLEKLKRSMPHIPRGYLIHECTRELIDALAEETNCACHCHYQGLDSDMINYAQDKNISLLTYTVNDPIVAQDLLSQGIFGVFTDLPIHEESLFAAQRAS